MLSTDTTPVRRLLQLSSTKPYLRKKAVLLMYKIFLKFPEALRPAFPRLKDKLDDPDPGENCSVGLMLLQGSLYSCVNNKTTLIINN